jgi:DNA repair exonuclease SbcCD ATPase subunit
MSENVVLRKSDKEILNGEKDDSDYDDYSTRRSQIRTRVRNRSEALVEELQLLDYAGETEDAQHLLETIIDQSHTRTISEIESRIQRIESDIQQIERRCSDVEQLKAELEEIREQL